MELDPDRCYRALLARDARFDGLFFVGVATTGIYCRPVCRARTPRRDRCSFYATPAVAEKAGFRACFRCRPELAPGAASVDAVPALVGRAVARIDEGFLNERSVDALAAELGVSARHLRRACEAELGVSPVELAQSRRLALAKRLLHDASLGVAEVAFASGFRSLRRFNALFAARFGRPPTSVRDGRASEGGGADDRPLAPSLQRARRTWRSDAAPSAIRLRLEYREPFAWHDLLDFLRPRAVLDVEQIEPDVYIRTVRVGDHEGTVRVTRDARRSGLVAEVSLALAPALMKIAARLRALFDLDADPQAVGAHLGRDPLLAPLVAATPGLRVPGAFDPFETAVRAVLGQQVSVRAATTLAGRFVARYGRPLRAGAGATFPDAATIAAAPASDLARIGLPGRRAETLRGLAQAFAAGHDDDAALAAVPGIGPWTLSYVAMRARRAPDAFPASDLGLRRALGGLDARAATARAESWRPWRSYAVMYLWKGLTP